MLDSRIPSIAAPAAPFLATVLSEAPPPPVAVIADTVERPRPQVLAPVSAGLGGALTPPRRPARANKASEASEAAEVDPLADLRSEMHRFVAQARLDECGIDPAWADAYIDNKEIPEDELRDQYAHWKAAVAARDAAAAAAGGVQAPSFSGPGAENIIGRNKIASPGKLSSRESNTVRSDLRKLHFATGPSGASGAWDADAFEGYKDFVERALAAKKLTPEVAYSRDGVAAVKALLHTTAKAASPDPALMATPAQATIDSTVGPEWVNKTIVTKHKHGKKTTTTTTTKRVSTGHKNSPADISKVRQALIDRGFYVQATGGYDTSLQQAIQLFNAAYNGLSERDGGSSSFASGTKLTRSLFGNPTDTPHLIDGPRWGELKADPSIGLEIYATPGSYTTSWGTQRARQFVIDFATALRKQFPDYILRANDISKREGGPHPFHHGHQVGREADLTHPDEPKGDNKQWVADRKAELKVMAQFKERIDFIYASQKEFLDYGKSLGLPMRHAGGHEGHFHVALKGWMG